MQTKSNMKPALSNLQDKPLDLDFDAMVSETDDSIYKLAFQTNPLSINISKFKDGMFILVNEAFEKNSGYTAEEVIGKTSQEINLWVNYEDREIFIAQLLSNNRINNFETNLQSKDGRIALISLSSRIIKYKNEACILTIGSNIQKVRQTEIELIKNKNHYQALFEESSSIMLIVDPKDGRIVKANNAAYNFYGYPNDVISQMKISDINIITEKKIQIEMKQAKLNRRNHFVFKHRLANDEVRDVEVYSGEILFEGKDLLYSIIHDISDRIRAEEKLENRETILNTVIKSMPFEVWARNKEGTCFLQNDNSVKSWGNLIGTGTNLPGIPCDTQELWESNNKKVYNGETINEENECTNAKGEKEFFQNIITPIKENDKIIGILGFNIDISERKKYEIELTKALKKAEESDRLKSAFLANMSHEIRTPMNGLVGFAEMLKECDLSEEKRKKYTDAITVSSGQLLKIVNDILDISRIETNQVSLNNESTNLNEVFQEIFEKYLPVAKENAIKLSCRKHLDDDDSIILCDKAKLLQILDNMVSNSLKFTQRGVIDFGYKIEKSNIEFHVRDTGLGIAPEYHEKVFERFFKEESKISYQYRGTGLGLSISKSYINLMGGRISLKSELDKGTTFYFNIPYQPNNSNTPIHHQKANLFEEISDRIITILIAEDEHMNYLYFKAVLASENINLLHAKNGEIAIDLCKLHPEIDLILMDIKMPVIDGFEATRIIRKFRPEIPIIAQTAYSLPEDKFKANKVGINDFLIKPVNYTVLKQKISEYL